MESGPTLGGGTHSLRFRGREIGTRLDSLILVRHPYEAPPPTIPAPASASTITPGAYPPMLWLPLLES